MRIRVRVVREAVFETDDYRQYFGAYEETDAQILHRLAVDNGQFTYLLGDWAGWENVDMLAYIAPDTSDD